MQATETKKRRSRSAKTVGIERDDLAILTARRIINAYGGIAALKELRDMFEKQVPGPQIAKRFDVTRQRISQWRQAIGNEFCVFSLRDCVEKVLKDKEMHKAS